MGSCGRAIFALGLGFLATVTASGFGSEEAVRPVTPNPSEEAVALLEFIQGVSGKMTLTGQHSVPLLASTRLVVAERNTGHYPALFGQDFGFDFPGTWDGVNFRQRIVDEAIWRHSQGFVITLMWHAVRPIEDEPVKFPTSIQGELDEEEWRDLITPGTEINERWKSQVDVIAFFLKQLRDAHVPVLWRPYHEMNGAWFWWGQKKGEDGYKKLYRTLFDRLTRFHGLNNLIWVFNANEVKEGVDPYGTYYPGDDVVDILATDVYTEGFNQENYDQLLALAGDKPIALGEVGIPPSLEILRAQPRWTWFMVWGSLEGGFRFWPGLRELYDAPETLTLTELPWVTKKPETDYRPH